MQLEALLKSAHIAHDIADADVEISSIAYDSRKVSEGCLFVAIEGYSLDGHDFIEQAVASKAAALVVSKEIPAQSIPCIRVSDTRAALADLAASFYRDPSWDVKVIGITGTNGKTTTTYLLDSILQAAGQKTGIVGTVQTRLGDAVLSSSRTTPESLELQALLSDAKEQGIDSVSMEVSSHAIELSRVRGIRFAAVAFTNISQDHLDFHADMDEYFAAKKRLFTEYDAFSRVICMESEEGRALFAELKGIYNSLSVGRDESYDLYISKEVHHFDRSDFFLHWNGAQAAVTLPIPGAYNVENALVAAGLALTLGLELDLVADALSHAQQVPGRLERVSAGQDFVVAVDYAHTPDSIEKAISAMREVSQGSIIAVFGCGGDRDPSKRPKMAAAAALADQVIATSDNPRTEDPLKILEEVEEGFKGRDCSYEIVVSRRDAIKAAIAKAKADDVVLIMGKGHEDYQIFAEETIHFDDREEALDALRDRGYQD